MRKSSGFTLVELVVVLAISAILSLIAWPLYQRYDFKVSHTDAVTGLMLAENRLENCASAVGGVYDGCNAGFPILSPNGRYTITVALGAPPATTYVLTATRVRLDPDETCGNFTLNELGQRGITLGDAQDCWSE